MAKFEYCLFYVYFSVLLDIISKFDLSFESQRFITIFVEQMIKISIILLYFSLSYRDP